MALRPRIAFLALIQTLLLSAAEIPSARALIDRAVAADLEASSLREKYAYKEEDTNRQIGKDGKPGELTSKTWDVVFLEGEPYRKLILIDGKPLPAATQRKVDEDYRKTRAQRRAAHHAALLHVERNVALGGLDDLLKYFDNRVTGEEELRGHRVWVVVSIPRPNLKPADKRQTEILSWSHKSYFDQSDGIRMQWEATVLSPVKGFQPGLRTTWEYGKGTEGVWLARKFTMTGEMNFYKMIHASFESVRNYTDYKKFDVTSTLTTGDEVK